MAANWGPPLPKKLGIKAGHKVCLLNAPGVVERALQREEVRITHDLRLPPVDVVLLFVECLADLEKRFSEITERLHPQGGFWVIFRTKRGDVTDEMVRRIALAGGMTDNKTVEIDASWCGMRLVLRPEIALAMMYRAVPPPVTTIGRRLRRGTASGRVAAPRTLTRTAAASGAGSSLRRARARSHK